MARLSSDVDMSQVKKVFEVISTDTTIFKGCQPLEIDEMLQVLKICNFKK